MAWSRMIPPLLGLILLGQPTGGPGKHYVVLSGRESKNAAKYVGHWPEETVNGTWVMSESDVEGVESNLHHIADIPFPNTAHKGSQIPHPEEYFRQYAGVLIDHRKIIFVNALCETAATKYETYWREKFVLVLDGGDCYWNVRYDPETKQFSQLVVSGVA